MATLDAKRVEGSLEHCFSSIESSISALETTVAYLSHEGGDTQSTVYPTSAAADQSESSKHILNSLFGKFDDATDLCEQLSALCSMTTLENLVEGGERLLESNADLLNHLEDIAVDRVHGYMLFKENAPPALEKPSLQRSKSGSFGAESSYFPTPSKAPGGQRSGSSAITPMRAKAAALASPADSNPPTPSLDDFGLSLNTVNLLQK